CHARDMLLDRAELPALIQRLQDVMAEHMALTGVLGDERVLVAGQRRDHGVDGRITWRILRVARTLAGKAEIAVVDLELGGCIHRLAGFVIDAASVAIAMTV